MNKDFNHYGIDAEKELIELLSKELTYGIDQDILKGFHIDNIPNERINKIDKIFKDSE